MKKMLLSIIASLAMFACSTSGSNLSKSDIVGEYDVVIDFSDIFEDTTDSSVMAAMEELKGIEASYIFKDNGELINTVALMGDTTEVILKWTLDGDTLTIINDEIDIPSKMAVKKSDSGLDLTNGKFKQALIRKR